MSYASNSEQICHYYPILLVKSILSVVLGTIHSGGDCKYQSQLLRNYVPRSDDLWFYHDLGYNSDRDDHFHYDHPFLRKGRKERHERWNTRGIHQADWTIWKAQYPIDRFLNDSLVAAEKAEHAARERVRESVPDSEEEEVRPMTR